MTSTRAASLAVLVALLVAFSPSASAELCDGFDNDGNGAIDEGCDRTCDDPRYASPDKQVTTLADAYSVDVASNGSQSALAWVDRKTGNAQLCFELLDPDDEPTAAPLCHDLRAAEVSIAWSGDQWGVLVLDSSNSNLLICRYAENGFFDGCDVVDTSVGGMTRSSLVARSPGFAAAYQTSAQTIKLAEIEVNGDVSASLRVDDSPIGAIEPSLAWGRVGITDASLEGYGVAWTDLRHAEPQVYFGRLRRLGAFPYLQSLGAGRRWIAAGSGIASSVTPAIAWSGDKFGIVAPATTDDATPQIYLYFKAFGPTGSESEVVYVGIGRSAHPDLVSTGEEFHVAWTRTDFLFPPIPIHFARLDANGIIIGDAETLINDGGAQSPSIAWTGSEPKVAYVNDRTGPRELFVDAIRCCDDVDADGFGECDGDADDNDPTVYPGAAELCDGKDNDGNGLIDETCDATCDDPQAASPGLLSSYDAGATATAVIWTGDRYATAWAERSSGIQLQFLDNVGESLGAPTTVAACDDDPLLRRTGQELALFACGELTRIELTGAVLSTTALTHPVDVVAWDGTGYGVIYKMIESGAHNAYFQRLDRFGNQLGHRLRIDDTFGHAGDLIWDGSGYALIYDGFNGVRVMLLSPSGSPDADRLLDTTSEGTSMKLVWNGNGYGALWQIAEVAGDRLRFVVLGTDGTGAGPLREPGWGGGQSLHGSLVWTGAEYGLAWQDDRTGGNLIYLARLDATGDEITEYRLNAFTNWEDDNEPQLVWTGTQYAVTFLHLDYFGPGDPQGDWEAWIRRVWCRGNDSDGDDVLDADDNCPYASNPDQLDDDDDTHGNACDNCADLWNEDQLDTDFDGIGEVCDVCPSDSGNDPDGDLYCAGAGSAPPMIGEHDNCPTTYNPLQLDHDLDGLGNLCDPDDDGDGVLDDDDNCRLVPNPPQWDFDGDGIGDLCDDSDEDGIVDAEDNCRLAPNDQADADSDGVGDVCDNCLVTPNGRLSGSCVHDGITRSCAGSGGCGAGGICDRSQVDSDLDGLGDACDPDDDNDGIADTRDTCRTVWNSYSWIPTGGVLPDLYPPGPEPGPRQTDTDGDGIGDACNDADDRDGDEWADHLDNCPDLNSWDQTDADGDGLGDRCQFDVTISAVEITQGIQRLDNYLPRVRNKDTWIRVYLDGGLAVNQYDSRLERVTGHMSFCDANGQHIVAYDGGKPFAPLINVVYPQPRQIPARRENSRAWLNAALNFKIGASWYWDSEPYLCIDIAHHPDETDWNNNYSAPIELDLKNGGILNLMFVPIKVEGCRPSLGDFNKALDYVKRTYPVSEVNVWEDDVLKYDGDPTQHGDSIVAKLWWRNLWSNDHVDDLHYFGLTCDWETIGASGDQGGTAGTTIINNEEAWSMVGAAPFYGGDSMAHELGHNYGQDHVPDPDCRSVENGNGSYPQYLDEDGNPLPRSSIGEFGFSEAGFDEAGVSRLQIFRPSRYSDFMSYCADAWISPYTYIDLYNEFRGLGLPPARSSAPQADLETLVVSGQVRVDDSVEIFPFRQAMLPADDIDESAASGLFSLELRGGGGGALYEHLFDLTDLDELDSQLFRFVLPWMPGTASIVLSRDGAWLAEVPVSLNAPQVALTYPAGGETLSGEQTVTWTASDADGDDLTFDLLYSRDDGLSWSAVDAAIAGTSFVWDTAVAAGSSAAWLKLIATDGVNTTEAVTAGSFSVTSKLPQVVILAPEEAGVHFLGDPVGLGGTAFDAEDGPLDGESLVWSSSLDGTVGTGSRLTLLDLSPGVHLLTLSAEDTDAGVGMATVGFTILDVGDSDGDGVGDPDDNCYETANADQTDSDVDGIGDACDADDSDLDGIRDYVDNCPALSNDQSDGDGDGVGDVCDNCPETADASQDDSDLDGRGDACDCAPADPVDFPGGAEYCDLRDNDCDGAVDEDCMPACAGGTPWNPATRVSFGVGGSGVADLIWNGREFGVAWHDFRDGNWEIYFARLSATGARLGDEVRVTDDAAVSGDASLAWTGNEYGVAWWDERDGNREIYFRRVDANGAAVGLEVRVTEAAGDSALPSLVWTGAEYALAWYDDRGATRQVYFTRLDSVGTKLVDEYPVSGEPASQSSRPALVWTGTGYGVAWEDDRDGNLEIYMTRLDPAGAKLGGDARLSNGADESSRVALTWNGTGFAAAWQDFRDGRWEIYFARAYADGTRIGGELRVTDNASIAGFPALEWTGSEYGVAWHDSRSGWQIHHAAVDPSGAKVGGDVAVTVTAADSYVPALAWMGDGYGVTWHEVVDGADEIYFVRVGCCADADADGVESCAGDCDDREPSRFPGGVEVCDGIDNDCDGVLPAAEHDSDFDGVTICAGDCAADDSSVYVDAPELNDGIDNQCPGDPGHGVIDELTGPSGFPDPRHRDRFGWPAQRGALSYEVARSTTADFSVDCATWTTADTYLDDPTLPATGEALFYLSRPLTPNPGSWGYDDSGAERALTCP